VSFLAAGQYIVSINDANGCNYSETYNLAQPQQVEVALGPDLTMEYGDSVMLQAQINLPPSQLDTIIWTPNDLFNCLDPEPCYTQLLIPQNQVIVSVTVFDTSGCFASDDISIIVKKTQSVFIPNIFTPNNDGFNDIFYILGGAEVAKVNKFKVFDRWGELMYQADLFAPNDPQYGWDGKHRGKPMNPAVFVYWAELQFTDGSVKFFKGDVTLIR
ncbi:MAG: T9SS type B sorting domain-containing protein, partial [Saprospiraceae bacterium]